mgnify:CR=1 FL=1
MSIGPRAHPRSRGENTWVSSGFGRAVGSSPLTRGKLGDHGLDRVPDGLIPAHAGKTRGRGRARTRWGAHPRSRGENAGRPSRHCGGSGSSPLTRGKPSRITRRPPDVGLIPAHAGKTSPRRGGLACLWAHPRSRGENAKARGYRTMCMGSSPLTRGKRTRYTTVPSRCGLIPAHAGKTGLSGAW